MKLFNPLKAVFGHNSDPFKDRLNKEFKALDIHDVRYLTDPIDLKPEFEISEPLFKPFSKAAVVLSDTPGRARPFIAGFTRNGEFKISSAANFGRPDDIEKGIDGLEARYKGHAARLALSSFSI